jgi:hypothetical protein
LSQRPRSAADTYHVITFIRDGARRAPPNEKPARRVTTKAQRHRAEYDRLAALVFQWPAPQNASNKGLTTFKESVSVIKITRLTILIASV